MDLSVYARQTPWFVQHIWRLTNFVMQCNQSNQMKSAAITRIEIERVKDRWKVRDQDVFLSCKNIHQKAPPNHRGLIILGFLHKGIISYYINLHVHVCILKSAIIIITHWPHNLPTITEMDNLTEIQNADRDNVSPWESQIYHPWIKHSSSPVTS